MDKISVIVPVYNCEEYIDDCLSSIANQTYKNIEVIMVNDGSKDKSDYICKKYAKKYDWKFINRKINKGPAYTRNQALKEITGDFVLFVDSDDLLYPNAIELLYNELLEYDSDLVISKLNAFDSNGEYGYYLDKYLKVAKTSDIFANKKLLNCISICAKLYKKETLSNVSFIDGTYHEDDYFSLRILLKSKKITVLPIYTYYRRKREGENKSIMQDLNLNKYKDLVANFSALIDNNTKTSKYKFLHNFMLRKSINYIIMNIGKNNVGDALKMHDKLLNDICDNNKFKYMYLRLKYSLYYHIARIYKKL